MTTVAAEELTAPQAAKMIAEEIRRKGHYQSQGNGYGGRTAPCCLVLNQVYPVLPIPVQHELLQQINDRARSTPTWPKSTAYLPRACAVLWNDRTPTEKVLEVLDAIAASDGA